ncbi:hypothetical protein LXL04_024842 [Taraxacum kok-saghyz]
MLQLSTTSKTQIQVVSTPPGGKLIVFSIRLYPQRLSSSVVHFISHRHFRLRPTTTATTAQFPSYRSSVSINFFHPVLHSIVCLCKSGLTKMLELSFATNWYFQISLKYGFCYKSNRCT